MFKTHTYHLAIALALAASAALPAAAKTKNVLDLKTSITDSHIIYPESYEADTQKLLEGWYLKNYTATDDRYARQSDVATDDATIKARLAKLPTVIDLPYNQIVRSYIDRYTQRGRAQVAALLGLSIYYMPIFEQALEEAGLPLELKYLPVIESGLDPGATSRHGAAGLWQFMINTGKGMGLEVSSLVDERRDPYLSSKKAAEYLKTLFDTYGDWSLAIAAYNCGPGAVNKAIRRAGGDPKSHDFWSIYNFLSPETRGYVPMFIAANYVMNYYPYHNISPVLPTKPLVTDTLMLSQRVHFDQISAVLDIPVEELRVLNPQFRADLIPGRPDKQYTLILPSQQCNAYIMSEDDILAYMPDKYNRRLEAEPGAEPGAELAQEIAEESPVEDEAPLEPAVKRGAQEQPAAPKGSSQQVTTVNHKVEAGQTLSQIARMYDVTPQQIKDWNGMQRNAVRTGQMLRITTTRQLAEANGARITDTQKESPRQNSWTAQNDSRKQQANQSSSRHKQSAQTARNSQSKKNKKKSAAKQAAPTSHTVKSGENLSVIAKRYGVTLEELKKSSGIKGDELHPGDKVKLPSKAKSVSGSKSGYKGKSSSKSKSGKSGKKRRR